MVLAATPDIDLGELKSLYKKDKHAAQDWLLKHAWYAHEHNSNFIKIYWLKVFDKKRPGIIPNYVVPNEFEVLFQQSNGSGLSVAFDSTVAPLVESGRLQVCELQTIEYRELTLIANKKRHNQQRTDSILKLLRKS